MNPLKCIDVDECEHGVVEFSDGVVQKACQRNAYCENAFGYYMCHCISGPFSNQGPIFSIVYSIQYTIQDDRSANQRSIFIKIIWTITYDMDHNILHGPYHMGHIIWFISYGTYNMNHII